MLARSGEITDPCGLPVFGSDHLPSSITPAFSHFWISRSMRGSATRCSTNLTSQVLSRLWWVGTGLEVYLLFPSPLAEPVEQISRNGLPRLHSLVGVTLLGGASRPRMVVGTRADSSDSTSTSAAAGSVVSECGPIAVPLHVGSGRASVYSGATR